MKPILFSLVVTASIMGCCTSHQQAGKTPPRKDAPAPLDGDYTINFHADTNIGVVDFSSDSKNYPMNKAAVIRVWIDTAGLTDKTLDSISWMHEKDSVSDWPQDVVGVENNPFGGKITTLTNHDSGEEFNTSSGETFRTAYDAVQDGMISFSFKISDDDVISFGVVHVRIEFSE